MNVSHPCFVFPLAGTSRRTFVFLPFQVMWLKVDRGDGAGAAAGQEGHAVLDGEPLC